MYVYERLKRLAFQVDFHLPEGARHLTAHMRITNPNPAPVPAYMWTNAAVPEEAGARVFSGTKEVILLGQSGASKESCFIHSRLPDPLKDGLDHSCPASIPHAEEYFFQNPADANHAFESVIYPDGRMTYERSTGNYPYRKMFCWGSQKGGKRWQDHLSKPGEGAYIEIQSGFFRTQQHTGFIGAGETWSLTQMFGGYKSDYRIFSGEYAAARENMQALMAELLPARALELEHERCLALETVPTGEILHGGAGWGALERLRDPNYLPAHLVFPMESMGEAQAPWAALLQGEVFPGAPSFMTAPEWLPVMKKALDAQPDNAALQTHYGIALYENGGFEDAKAAWEKAAALSEEPLALRNLSVAASREGDRAAALDYMERAIGALPKPERAWAEEYLKLLTDAGLYKKAWAFYRSLPDALQKGERLSVTAAESALELGEEAFLNEQFARTFSLIREGETALLDLWFRREAMREAARRGVGLTEALLKEVRKTAKPPENLDFRMLS
jgi:tetratricopeptide (TPR) repeat protein